MWIKLEGTEILVNLAQIAVIKYTPGEVKETTDDGWPSYNLKPELDIISTEGNGCGFMGDPATRIYTQLSKLLGLSYEAPIPEAQHNGGVWLNKSAAGETYMSGNFGVGAKLLIFKNKNKATDNQPDYNVYIVAKEQPQDGADGDGGAGGSSEEMPF